MNQDLYPYGRHIKMKGQDRECSEVAVKKTIVSIKGKS